MKFDAIVKLKNLKKVFGWLSQHQAGIAISLLLLVALTITFAVSAYNNRTTNTAYKSTAPATTPQPLPRVTPSRAQADDLSVELLTIHPYGFEPEELTLTKGRFLLAIDNRSNLNQVSVQLLSPANAQGVVVRSQVNRMAKGNLNWNQVVDLQPGEYLLTEESHPQWTCKITIKEK